mgnify:CR=1 FL=1
MLKIRQYTTHFKSLYLNFMCYLRVSINRDWNDWFQSLEPETTSLTSSLFLRKSFLFTENGTFWDFRGKFFANQVIKVICILQFFIDSYTSDEKSLSSKSLFLCVSILMFFSYLKFIFLILGLYTLWAIIIIMKQLFIIIIIAQRLYGSKIQKKI